MMKTIEIGKPLSGKSYPLQIYQPCPFCGTVEHLKMDDALRHSFGYEVWCSRCGLYGPTGFDESEALKKWNHNCQTREHNAQLDYGCFVWSD